ncbi:MAG TPA: phosphatidylglycerophosphatase A [Vicinamibacterales bacterium]|nr:phosphatidylglycerophosphatase A [Vicinamibacterales bacterium]
MNGLAVWIATSGPAGYAPVAPGTFGSAVGVALFLLIGRLSLEAQIAVSVVMAAVGIWASSVAAHHFDRSDPSQVVVDEVVGQVVTLVGLGLSWTTLLLGFLIFRALDIIKPWPANQLERLHGGRGIMADDLMAALYGQALLRGIIYFFPWYF